ncbi:MAG: hypothetical protein C0445_02175 [Polaromonas sp.]|nr:hypothetical protein [Polaromonas sp.]
MPAKPWPEAALTTPAPTPPGPPAAGTDAAPGHSGAPHWRVAAAWLAVVLALLAVFALYRRPDFLLTLADQVWSCF